jgi:hypothetical protein
MELEDLESHCSTVSLPNFRFKSIKPILNDKVSRDRQLGQSASTGLHHLCDHLDQPPQPLHRSVIGSELARRLLP